MNPRDAMDQLSAKLTQLSPEQLAELMQRLKGKEAGGASAGQRPRQNLDELPLSFAQQRLWFIDQLEPGSPAYNIPFGVRIRGRLDEARLSRTLNEVVSRHATLRTTFPAVDGVPRQVIAPPAPLDLPVIDLSGLPESEREPEVRRLVREDASRPFDLARGPLLRASLLRLSDDEHVALFNVHHIVADGWSTRVLVREVSALYNAYTAGQPNPLPDLPLQYAEYAAWQRERMEGELLRGQLAYWTERLAGAPPLLELPTDRPRPAQAGSAGGSLAVKLSREVTDALTELARREGATLFMALLAAYQLLLSRYSGQDDVVVGSPISGRNRKDVEGLVGFFANTLALRTDLSGDPTFRELLARVRETTLGAYANQDLPFERLVEELDPDRGTGSTPIFQAMFVLLNLDRSGTRMGGLEVEPEETLAETAKFDVLLGLSPLDGVMRGYFEYRAELFDRATAERMLAHFKALLESIVANPDARISRLAMVGPDERACVLNEWNATQADHPSAACVHDLFADRAMRTPDAVAVSWGDANLSYAELDARSNRLARHLRKLGVGPDVRVGISLERGAEMMVSVLAVLKAGGAYVPVDPAYPADRIAYMLADSAAPVLITQTSLADALPQTDSRVVCVDADADRAAIDGESADPIDSGAQPDNLAYVIYTSGSTGRPKGVAMTHRVLVNLLAWQQREWKHPSSATTLQFTTLSFDVSFQEIFSCWLSGGRLVLVSEDERRDFSIVVDRLGRDGVERLFLPYVALQHLAEVAEERGIAPRTLREVQTAGEQLRVTEPIRRFFARTGATLSNQYGPSETHVVTALTLDADPETWPVLPGIGTPIANTRGYVLDRNLEPTPIGVPGELYLGGVAPARGYLNRAGLTAERFVPDPHDDSGARMYRTGDRARWLADGTIEFLGRVDDQVKVRGFRIEPGEIEAALSTHPAVREAVVVVREDAPGDKRLVGYVVPSPDAQVSAAELRKHLEGRLPDYMVPGAFVVLDAFPLTPSGKVARRALPAPDAAASEEAYVAPRTPGEERLAAIFAEVLRAQKVGARDGFFALGGHSLLATRLISRVREGFGVELPLRALFEAPTVEGLAARIEALVGEGASAAKAPPIVPIPREGNLPLSFAQRRLWFIDQMEPGSAAYNLPHALRLTGALDVAALERGLGELTRRHETLRTRFLAVSGEPVQVIDAPSSVRLDPIDVSQLSSDEREAAVQRLAQEEAARPFDLARGPLMRTALIRLAEDEHALLFTLHHIVSDGWSTAILVREISELYAAFSEGREPRLPDLPVQYADFAAWQRAWLEGEVLEAQLGYWRERLAGAPPLLELPTDRPRPQVQSDRGGSVPFALPNDVTRALRALALGEGATLFMALLAAWKLLLSRYAGQDDVVVGTPVAGRTRLETEGLIGFFVNTLVLRTDLSGSPSFRDLLARVREATLGAYQHQDVPFEKLVEELAPERSLSHTPLFQVVFMLQNDEREALRLGSLHAEPLAGAEEAVKFDLVLTVAEDGDHLSGSLSYRAELFDAATVERMLAHFAVLLRGIAARPDAPAAELPLLPEAERLLLDAWLATGRAYPAGQRVHDLFAAQAAKTPDAPALVFGGEAMTYADLDQASNRLANHLRRLGVDVETRVGVCLERTPELIVSLLAVLKAGGAYVPLDPAYPRERLGYMTEDAGVRLVLTTSHLAGRLPEAVEPVRIDAIRDAVEAESADAPSVDVDPENLSHVIFTSGSTGRPKGVMIRHSSTVVLLHWLRENVSDEERASVLGSTSINFDVSIAEIFGTLCWGGKLVLVENALDLPSVADQEIRYASMVPTAAAELLRSNGIPASVRTLNLGGEALPNDLAQALYGLGSVEKVGNLYGPTEDTTYSTYSVVARGADRVLVGKPVANTRAYVLDANLRPVPVGVIGELYLAGDGLSRGYAGRPDLTAERFVPDPFGVAGARMYRVMDRIRWRADGELEYFGRTDFQVKVRGFRIELGEIETVLRAHPSLLDAVAVVREDSPGDRRLVAYVVAKDGESAPGTAELRAHVGQHLPEYMVPSAFVPLAALPLTPNGKVDRRALPAPDAAGIDAETYVAPRTEAEEQLAAVFAEVLGLQRVGVHDDFFDLGGHSLLATRVTTRVREIFGAELAVRTLFESPTVAELAPRVDAGEVELKKESTPLVPVPRDRPLPLSFAQRRFWMLHQVQGVPESYNLSVGLRLKGEVRVDALRRAIEAIVARHEALRTSFAEVDGEPAQIVEPPMPFELPLIDLSAFPEDGRDARIRRHAEEDAARPFSLEHPPLVRATLLRLGEREHVLLASMHHIAADGWSTAVFTDELVTHYQALLDGAEAHLPPLEIQYGDYAVWQRARAGEDGASRQLGYWKRALAGAPAAIALPADRPRPPVQRFRGDTFEARFDAGLADELRALARAEDSTLFMALLAGFGAFLARYTGQDDVVVGSPVAGRDHPALEPLIGCFINLLPIRLRPDASESFRSALHRVRATALDAFAHQDVSFDEIVDAAGMPRDTSRNPLVQVLFALQNTPASRFTLPGLEAEALEGAWRTSRYDLSLYVREEADGGLSALVEFDTDLFDRATVERWMRHYARLLASLAARPDQPQGAAEMLDDAERERVLREWNRTATPFDASQTIHAAFEAQARRTPDATALVAGDESISYAELNRRANRLAHQLRARGIGPESRVGLLLERSAAMVVSMLAVLKAGGAYVPLDPAYPSERVRFMAEDAGLSLVLADADLRSRFSLDVPVLVPSFDPSADSSDGDPNVAMDGANAAYVIYTSGSTGRPKGVVVQHRNAANFFAAMDERVGAEPGAWLAVTSISFDISVLEILWTLSRGSRVVLHGDRPRAAPVETAPARTMDFSLFFFASSESARPENKYRMLMEGARFADRAGFTAVWTPERHFHDFGGLYPNPSVTGAAVAAVTERVKIRAGSVVLPLQDPLRVAEEWSVVDNLSGGRAEISFASGWHANDFVLAPDAFPGRREGMFAAIETVRRLWRGETVVRRNGKGEDVEVRTLPRPVQPELPVWITSAGSPDTFRRAGRTGANLLTHLLGQGIRELEERIRAYREGRREAGLDPDTGRVALMLHTFVGDDADEVRETVRRPFREYLRSSFDLLLQLAPNIGYDPNNLSAEDVEALLDYGFDRFYETAGLMGTPRACLDTVRRLKTIGVDEVACLVDFGVDEDRVVGGFDALAGVMRDANAAPASLVEDGATIAERIRAHGVTHLQCTPSMAGVLAADPDSRAALAGLQCILVGGEALPSHLARTLKEATVARLLNMYGPTETTVWSTVHEVDGAAGPVSIGRPVANTRVYVVDDAGQPAPAGIAGELLIGGEGVVRGYHARAALTAERFVPDPFSDEAGSRLYRTGDLARWKGDGTLEFLGRIDQQVKVRGHRIEPGEIETALAAHPAVRESVVVAKDDGTGERRLVAYVTPAASAEVPAPAAPVIAVSPEEQERILADLPRYTLPGGVVIAHQQDFITHGLFAEIFADNSYLRHGITLEDGARVVDVGSNIGMFTLFAHAAAKDVRTWSFEPIPDTFQALKANAALLGERARVFNAGLADAEGTARFTFYPHSTGLSGRYADVARDRETTRAVIENWLNGTGEGAPAPGITGTLTREEVDAFLDERFRAVEFDCPLRTLSSIIREEGIDRIDLLKVDVEKSEYDVLMGIDDEHWPIIRQLSMEVDTEELLEKITALLEKHGYEHLHERYVTIREGQDGDTGEHVYMLYARRPGDGPPLRRAAAAPPLPSATELRRWVAERLPDYMVPSLFVTLDALPLTPNGKVDRKALPDAGPYRPALEVEYAPPRNDLEGTISEVWREVLGVERVGIRDNFFELGGTSVRLAAVHRMLSERLERGVTVVDLFRYPTVQGLAEYLSQKDDGGARKKDEVRERAERQRQAQEARRGRGRGPR